MFDFTSMRPVCHVPAGMITVPPPRWASLSMAVCMALVFMPRVFSRTVILPTGMTGLCNCGIGKGATMESISVVMASGPTSRRVGMS